jgi:hypothetical protein
MHYESSSGRNWGTQTMRLHPFAFLALLIAPVLVTAQGNLGTYEDRVAVEDVMVRYVWEEIRKIVTGLIQRRDDNKAKGLPPSKW